jgi:hypothetical protein
LDFGLILEKHIIGTTGDGASVMKSFGMKILSEYIQCDDHGVHLGVTKVLYQNITSDSSNGEKEISEQFCDEGSADENDDEDIQEVDDDNGEEEGDENDIAGHYMPTIKRMRKIVNHFRRSSVHNEVLQRFVFNDKKKTLKLISDSKTRWGSLYDACKRFLDLSGPIEETIHLLNLSVTLPWNEIDTDRLKVIYFQFFRR